MTKVMTPSIVTAGQIGKIQELLGASLRKSLIPSKAIQELLESEGEDLVRELFATVRRRAEARCDVIIRRVHVNRDYATKTLLKGTERKLLADERVVSEMPYEGLEEGKVVDVYFFNVGKHVEIEELQGEYLKHGLMPASPYALMAVNLEDPTFSDEHPNATHWTDSEDNQCFIAFDLWATERHASINRRNRTWNKKTWFAGVPRK
jgi:hypothetical protein